MIQHIYVHIPFCARICPYCAFYKELLDRSQTDRFCESLVLELQQYATQREFSSAEGAASIIARGNAAGKRYEQRNQALKARLAPSTIYFGGGTPTALTTLQLDRLLTGFRELLDLRDLAEWTMEANPGSVSSRKAELLLACGVNRISLGVQSWDDNLLQLLGREHNSKQAEESFQILRSAGFSNVNIDLMFALPGQTAAQWQATLEKTIALGPDHISTYCLTYEEDTDFFLRHSRGEFRSDNDAEARLFEMTMSTLQSGGYQQYEISNYARPGFESVHNRAYWAGADYLGIGPSAFSTVDLKRWQNIANYRDYADRVSAGQSAINSVEDLSAGTKNTERIALGLRTREGVAANLLKHRPNETSEFVKLGLLEKQDENFVLTEKGRCLADSVAEALV